MYYPKRFDRMCTPRSRGGWLLSFMGGHPLEEPQPTCYAVGVSRTNRSDHLRRERDDLHEPCAAELAGDWAEDAGADRLIRVVDEHC